MFNYEEYFSNLSCYEEYCLKCTLLGKDKSDKEILHRLYKNEDYYYFIDNNGEVVWLDDNGNEITNPEITKIENDAFSCCTFLKSITIPNSVTKIGYRAFYECKSLESITIPSSITEIGHNAFSGCKSLKSITIPNSVIKIENDAFYDCISLEAINIPNSVTEIRGGTFSYCKSLKSITIPNSVTEIGHGVFYGTSLKEVIISKDCKIKYNSFPDYCKIIRK